MSGMIWFGAISGSITMTGISSMFRGPMNDTCEVTDVM